MGLKQQRKELYTIFQVCPLAVRSWITAGRIIAQIRIRADTPPGSLFSDPYPQMAHPNANTGTELFELNVQDRIWASCWEQEIAHRRSRSQ